MNKTSSQINRFQLFWRSMMVAIVLFFGGLGCGTAQEGNTFSTGGGSRNDQNPYDSDSGGGDFGNVNLDGQEVEPDDHNTKGVFRQEGGSFKEMEPGDDVKPGDFRTPTHFPIRPKTEGGRDNHPAQKK